MKLTREQPGVCSNSESIATDWAKFAEKLYSKEGCVLEDTAHTHTHTHTHKHKHTYINTQTVPMKKALLNTS